MKHAAFIAGVVVAATALTVTAARAQMTGYGEGMSFQALDADGNGEVTRDEIAQYRAARFEGADTDGDGRLSQAEITAAAQARAADRAAWMIDRFDTDGDGALSAQELPKMRRAAGMFDWLDRDSSGTISEAEFADARAHAKGRMKRRSDKN